MGDGADWVGDDTGLDSAKALFKRQALTSATLQTMNPSFHSNSTRPFRTRWWGGGGGAFSLSFTMVSPPRPPAESHFDAAAS